MIRFKPIPENIHQRIASLLDFFGGDPDIIFAYLLSCVLLPCAMRFAPCVLTHNLFE